MASSQPFVVTLDDVFGNRILVKEFSNWAEEAFCLENISFYKAVKELKNEGDPDRLRSRILEVKDNFIVQDAPEMLNVDHDILKSILERLKTRTDALQDRTLFDPALTEVTHLMQYDMLPKFLRQREALEGPLTELPRDSSNDVAPPRDAPLDFQRKKQVKFSVENEEEQVDLDLHDAGLIEDDDLPIPMTWTNYRAELWRVIKLAAPISGSFLATMTIGFVNTLLLGRLGKIELAAAALSNMYCNVTGLSIGIGLLSAMDTLCSQAYGAGNLKRVGLVTQRSIAIMMVVCIPVFFIWLFAEQILLLLKQSDEIAPLGGLYARWLFPGLAPLLIFECMKRYLQSQGITTPIMIVSAIGAVLSLPVGWLLIFGMQLGYIGAPITTAFLWTLMAVALFIYIKWKRLHVETWPELVWSDVLSRSGWLEFFKLGLPGAAMTAGEWWTFELYALMAGWISTLALAIQTILMTTVSMLFMIPLGLSVSIGTLVGNRLGANRPQQASFSSKVSISFTISIQLILSFTIFLLRPVWGKIFNDETEVIDGVASYLPVTCLFIISDGLQGSMTGILRGSGRQKWGAAINICCYYLLGMPTSYLLAFKADWKTSGLWAGFASASWIVVCCYTFLILRSDWKSLAQEARDRANSQGALGDGSVHTELTSAFSDTGDESDEEERGYSQVKQTEL